jgi:predicted nuclease with RNAse H fold
VLTAGVDLAARPEGTAIAYLEWSLGRASLRGLVIGANDQTIVEAVRQADKVGIDCPLGWPVPFVEFVAAHQRGNASIPPDLPGRDWRRRLAYRRTDLAVREATEQRPLRVAADRIGHTAMRAAGLLARLAAAGHPVDRTGTGVVVEVYPAASLRCWELLHQGFKGAKNLTALGELVDRLQKGGPVAGPRRVRDGLPIFRPRPRRRGRGSDRPRRHTRSGHRPRRRPARRCPQ